MASAAGGAGGAKDIQAQVKDAVARVRQMLAAEIIERVQEKVAAAERKVQDDFRRIIELESERDHGKFFIKQHGNFDYYIGLPLYKESIDQHHVHFYIRDGKIVWHYSNHDKQIRDPPNSPNYYTFTDFNVIYEKLLEGAKIAGTQSLSERYNKAKVHDPFESRGQRQKRSCRCHKRSCRCHKKSCRCHKKSCRCHKRSCRCHKKSCRCHKKS